jgi:hypothetical protein
MAGRPRLDSELPLFQLFDLVQVNQPALACFLFRKPEESLTLVVLRIKGVYHGTHLLPGSEEGFREQLPGGDLPEALGNQP